MKKLYIMAALGAMMMLGSCSNENQLVDDPTDDQVVMVKFTAKLPDDVKSRATTEGLLVSDLDWILFDSQGRIKNHGTIENAFDETDRVEELYIPLLRGHHYNVAFWTDCDDSPYTIDFDNGVMDVDTTKCFANDERADAFYAAQKVILDNTTPDVIEITMRRPFAQINFGATSLDAITTLGESFSNTGVFVKDETNTGAYTRMDLHSGFVSKPVETIHYKPNGLPNNATFDNMSKFSVDGGEFFYIAYCYVLAPENGELLESVRFTTDISVSPIYSNIPIKRNYRTNVLGNLFSTSQAIDVYIGPDFDGATNYPYPPVVNP